MFTSQDHQLTQISPIVQAWFLYSVNIYKWFYKKLEIHIYNKLRYQNKIQQVNVYVVVNYYDVTGKKT